MTEDAEWQRKIADNAQRCADLQARVAAIAVTETSPDGMVRVTVSANGVLTDLVLNDRRQFVPLAQVGALIMNCVRRAQAKIPDLVHQAMQQTVGVADPGAQLILADARAKFPPPPPGPPPRIRPVPVPERAPAARPDVPPPPPPAPARSRPPEPHYDTDWDERPVLEALDGDGR